MRLHVVGSSASVPRPGRACSCYLLRTREATLLFDLGSGALANLHETIEYSDLDAVLISHMHADHFLDLIPLRYGLKYGPLMREDRMPLWLPPGGEAMLRKLCSAFAREGKGDFLNEVFDVKEYDPKRPLEVGDVRVTFRKTVHYIDAYAMRAERSGASIVYSADTAPCDEVVEHAKNCSLFLCEASLGLGEEIAPRGHSSAAEAGHMARLAGAHRLVLTHYGSEYAPRELEEAGQEAFGGPCAVVDDKAAVSV